MKTKPKVIYCANGNKKFAEIAIENGFIYGAQLPGTVYYGPFFVDQNWKNPQKENYISLIKQYKPYMATVIDVETEAGVQVALDWAEEIAPHVNKIVVIPKIECDVPSRINGKEVIIGYSVPTKYGGTTLPLSIFNSRKIHLLGGNPHTQMKIVTENNNIYSVDGNYHQMMAIRHNSFWQKKAEIKKRKNAAMGKFVKLKDFLETPCEQDCPYMAFELSCKNIMEAWGEIV